MQSLRIDEFEPIVWVLYGLFTVLGWLAVCVYHDGVHCGWLIWVDY
jgi:hypothetical protein